MIVALHGVEFFAHHGFYPEEQKIGNHFIVDIEVAVSVNDDMADELGNTVNYERLYDLACEQMKLTRKLIETVAQAIIDDIRQEYPLVETIKVSVKKLNPLIGAKVKYSEVVLKYNRA